MTTAELLEQFKNKGAAWQSQKKAEALILQLRKVLSDDDWWKLHIAHSHYKLGEGAAELYDVSAELINKYKKPQ